VWGGFPPRLRPRSCLLGGSGGLRGIISPLYPTFRVLVTHNGVTHLPFIVFKYGPLICIITNITLVKKMNRKVIGFGIILATLLAPIAVNAMVTFDPLTGKGFVGKGDVQTAFGWNNAALQKNAELVTFTYVTTDTYTVTEVWATGNMEKPTSINSHEITKTKILGISGAPNYDLRKVNGQKQWTGFILTGYNGDPRVTGGELPTPDTIVYISTWTYIDKEGVTQTVDISPDSIPTLDGTVETRYSEGGNKAVLSVVLTSSTGGLYANYGIVSVLIWPPVV